MLWRELAPGCKWYFMGIYGTALPLGVLCFVSPNSYSYDWLLLTLISLFIATVNIRIPKISAVVSMGDVFTILALTQFGPGPALITYWLDIVTAHVADVLRRAGIRGISSIKVHKFVFNIASCSISVFVMSGAHHVAMNSGIPYPINFAIALAGIALGWFTVNTVTLSLAISHWTNQSFWLVWREGVVLALLNFVGSAAAAGLISMFYQHAGLFIFLTSLPFAVVMYQLYAYHVERYEAAQLHISQLRALYVQTVEALANAVDAKDRYTHGHIRRVQAYAVELAICLGLSGEQELMGIKASALLHDIGKIAIPEYILNKPTVLTETEYEKMKIHPIVGANMLKNIDFPYPVVPAVKSHHERWDGNGYPEGLKREEIPMNARILALVDSYDALTTNRPYRSPMPRQQVIELFRSESGRAYDPNIVEIFIANIDRIEAAGRGVEIPADDVWGIREIQSTNQMAMRQLEGAQPTLSYGKALSGTLEIQRELYSAFEFAHADIQCLDPKDVYTFMGVKLEGLITFDAAVFFRADLAGSLIAAEHIVGPMKEGLSGLTLSLEQKLSGWVAANNQPLWNLPPFPDFLNSAQTRPSFQISAIAPLNHRGSVLGAIALYRAKHLKFLEEEFRRLEIIASQAAIALDGCTRLDDTAPLLDSVTNLPSGLQLYLMFNQIAIDAHRYEYPLTLLSVHLEEVRAVRQRWGYSSGDEIIRSIANRMLKELREADLLVRFGSGDFLVLSPRTTREAAERLKSRLQDDLDRFRFRVRPEIEIPLRTSVGFAMFPEDGTELEALLSVAECRVQEDRELRLAVAKQVRKIRSKLSTS